MSDPPFTPGPWTYEVHELSEGYSAIVYDARGQRLGGLDHLDEATAALIAAAPELYEAVKLLLRGRSYHADPDVVEKRVTEGIVKGLAAMAKARGGRT